MIEAGQTPITKKMKREEKKQLIEEKKKELNDKKQVNKFHFYKYVLAKKEDKNLMSENRKIISKVYY